LKTLVGLIVARPLIAIALAVVVVAVLYLGFTHRQTTPVTHRTERVGLTDKEQMQLGSEEYAKTLRQYRRRIVSSGAAYAEVQRVAKRMRPSPAATSPDLSGE
jgi:type II secretory pathway component PulK